MRNNDKRLCDVFPQKDINGNYRIGVFIRDDLCGLGTVTFSNKDGEFASLGHPVTNATGDIIEIKKGEVFDSTIIGVTKAKRGKAGELKGMFIGDNPIGVVNKNTSVGMFGKFYNFNPLNHRKIQVSKGCIGKAQILSTVDSKTVEYFDIEIVKIDYRKGNNKNFVIKITDKDLIEKTGGILQGMSGSPIIQDNKLIGAVTHVFINDSTRGYGISINNMIECLD